MRCPYCRHRIQAIGVTLWRCLRCDLIGNADTKPPSFLLDHYRRLYYARNGGDQTAWGRSDLYAKLADWLQRLRPMGTLLDVGAGFGVFADTVRQRGWHVTALEPSDKAVDIARKKFKLDVVSGTLRDLPGLGPFDVVTFINVIDHTAAPWEDVNAACNLIKPGGLLFMRFPNGWLHAHLLKMACRLNLSGWVRPYLVFHAYSLTPAFMRRLLADQGFVDIRIANSPLTRGDPYGSFRLPWLAGLVKGAAETSARAVWGISNGRLCCGPSLIVTAFAPK